MAFSVVVIFERRLSVNEGLYGPVVREAYDGMRGSRITIHKSEEDEFLSNEIVCCYAFNGNAGYFPKQEGDSGVVNFGARLSAEQMDWDEVQKTLERLPRETNHEKAAGHNSCTQCLANELRRIANRLGKVE